MTIALEPTRRTLLFELFARHNPFYLLSAACMLAGCLALANTTTYSPIGLDQLVPLIVTLNVYELALIALALYLVRRRGLVRDGWMLLLLQAVFLVDITFLNAEIATLDLTAGLIANVIIFALAIVKVGVVLRVLEVRLPVYKAAFIGVQLLVLFSLPIVFEWIGADALSPLHFYAAWWLVGVLPAVYMGLERLPWGNRVQSVAPPAQAVPAVWYLALPYLSMLLHLGILHFVYEIRFYGAHAAPVLLGLAFVMSRVQPSPFAGKSQLLFIQALLPGAAILVSWNNPSALGFAAADWLQLAPLALAIAGAYLTYVFCFMPAWAFPMLGVGVLAAAGHLFGPAFSDVTATAGRVYAWAKGVMMQVVPRTARGWGVVGVVAAFVFLAIGAAISLRKRPDGEGPSASDEAPSPPVPEPAAIVEK